MIHRRNCSATGASSADQAGSSQSNWTFGCHSDNDIRDNERERSEPDEKNNWTIHFDSRAVRNKDGEGGAVLIKSLICANLYKLLFAHFANSPFYLLVFLFSYQQYSNLTKKRKILVMR
jgi:hypothetical protein